MPLCKYTARHYETQLYPWPFPQEPIPFLERNEISVRIGTHFAAPPQEEKVAFVVLHGVGGSGKSSAAVCYASRHRSRYNLVAWLKADTKSSLENDLISLAEDLKIIPDSKEPLKRKFKRLYEWLSKNKGWLLIFDNADKPISLDVIPEGGGHVIITTRSPSWWNQLGLDEKNLFIPVDSFDSFTGIDLLKKYIPQEEDEIRLSEITSHLGSLPLGLAQTGAYMYKTKQFSSQKCLSSLKKRKDAYRLFKQNFLSETLDPRKTLSLTFHLHIESLASESQRFLDFCAYLVPDQTSLPILLASMNKNRRKTYDELDINELAEPLVEIALLTRVSSTAFRIHSLVQQTTDHKKKLSERHGLLFQLAETAVEEYQRRQATPDNQAKLLSSLKTIYDQLPKKSLSPDQTQIAVDLTQAISRLSLLNPNL